MHDVLPILGRPLVALEALGCPRPVGLSPAAFLESLVSRGLLPAGPVRAYLDAYQEVRFGNREVAAERVSEAVAALEEAMARSADRHRSAWEALAQELLCTGSRQAAPEPRPSAALGVAPADSPAPQRPVPVPRAESRPRRRGRIALILVGLALWSLVMAWAGHEVGTWWAEAWRPPRDGTPGGMASLAAVRKKLVARPGDLNLWWRLANLAGDLQEYPEAIAAYHRILSRQPDNPEALNNLAWLYLTAEDPLVHDPVIALPMAEKALQRLGEPFVEDTLAEALFQNDRPDEAIILAEDALSRARTHREYYQSQLVKFREAAANLWNPRPICCEPDAGIGE